METKIQILKSERRIYGFFWAISLVATILFSLFTFAIRGKITGLTIDNQILFNVLTTNVAAYFLLVSIFVFVCTSAFWFYVNAVICDAKKLIH